MYGSSSVTSAASTTAIAGAGAGSHRSTATATSTTTTRSIVPKEEEAVLTWSNVSYQVDIHPTRKQKRQGVTSLPPKQILQSISGIAKPGETCAIFGPTGSGKSSLLDILAGRKDTPGLSGVVCVNGAPIDHNFKQIAGYVVQDDIVMGTLSVRENLMFSAELRLPQTISTDEKKRRVAQVIQQLGLLKCADQLVGTEMIRGISGGERKRTNIGMELIISPKILFCDEPTTGLDAATAGSVIALLTKLAKAGRTVILSIHQPRYAIYKRFNRLYLLSSGRLVYGGPREGSLGYFQQLGHECEANNNPADFFLDVISADERHQLRLKCARDGTPLDDVSDNDNDDDDGNDEANRKGKQSESTALLSATRHEPTGNDDHNPHGLQVSDKPLPDFFLESSEFKALNSEIQVHNAQHISSAEPRAPHHHGIHISPVMLPRETFASSFSHQFSVLAKRTVLNLVRNPQTSIAQVIVAIFFAALNGFIYFQLGFGPTGIQNRVGVLFFLIMNVVFSNLSAIQLFLSERNIFIHEKSSGYYTTFVYFLCKIFCDMIPMRLIPGILSCTVSYWMIGLREEASAFFTFVLILQLTAVMSSAFCFFVSASVSIFAIANLLVAMTYVLMMLASGLLINLNDLPVWLIWLRYISFFRYAMEAASINEFQGVNFTCPVNGTTTCMSSGDEYLAQQDFNVDNLWYDCLAMVAFTVFYSGLCYIQLRRIKRS